MQLRHILIYGVMQLLQPQSLDYLPATYTVTITDNTGCTSTESGTITEPTALIATTVIDF